MDKQIENEMYDHSYRQLLFGDNESNQRKVLLTRIPKLSSSESDTTHQLIGSELQNEGQLQKSIPLFKKATIINPHNDNAQFHLVKTLFELEKENEAFSCMKKALSLDPESSRLHDLLVRMFEKKGKLGDFESFSNEIADMIPDPKSIPSFYFESAKAWLNCGNSALALLACRKAMKGSPPIGDRWRCLYGEVLKYEGLYEEALIQFEQVKKGPSSNGEFEFLCWADKYQGLAMHGAAYVTYCLGGVQTAKEEFEKIIGGFSETHQTMWNYFLVLCHIGLNEKDLNHYKNHELRFYFFPSDGDEWVRFYEQELKNTQKILERGDVDEYTRRFNAKKLKALDVFLPILKERAEEETYRSQWCW